MTDTKPKQEQNTEIAEKMPEQKRASRRRKINEARKSLEMKQAEKEIQVSLTAKEKQEIKDLAESPEEEQELTQSALAAKKNKAALKQAKEKVNPAVPSEQLLHKPSYGHITGTATIHTVDAYRFILGREASIEIKNGKRIRKPRIIGLLEAASQLKKIEAGYRMGCPYAASTLIEIEKQITHIREIFAKTEKEAKKLIEHSSTIKLDPFCSRNPAEVPLLFSSTYGFHYSDLLAKYDLILRPVLNYRIHHFVTYAEYVALEKQIGTPLRKLFRLASSWSFVGREAVINKTAELSEAEYKMGILSEDIISGKIAPAFINSQGYGEIND